MALSNLRNEPRREIIEQAVGAAFIVGFLAVDYVIVRLFFEPSDGWWLPFYMVCGGIGLFVGGVLLTAGVHAVGEGVCAILRNVGADPRPKRRF